MTACGKPYPRVNFRVKCPVTSSRSCVGHPRVVAPVKTRTRTGTGAPGRARWRLRRPGRELDGVTTELRDLSLIAFGLVVMSAVPINTEISNEHLLTMGTTMVLAVGVPYLVSRFVYRDHAIRFPVRTGQHWTRFERGWLVAVVMIGYLLLPVYLIRTEV